MNAADSAAATEAIAVIPSYRASIDQLSTLTECLRVLGIQPIVAPTSRRLLKSLDGTKMVTDSPGRNAGFGATVTHVATAHRQWDWLFIVNDDIAFEPGRLAEDVRRLMSRPRTDRVLCYLDPTPPKAMPTTWDVLGQVSLLTPILMRLLPRRAVPTEPDPRLFFRPFSFAAVSRSLWDDLQGLDSRLVFTYEDADFGRRAAANRAEVLFLNDNGIQHHASSTTRRHVDRVLPVAAWSACEYLAKWSLPRPVARALCVLALVLRVLFVPVAGLPKKSHVSGIARAIQALLSGSIPSLPDFETI